MERIQSILYYGSVHPKRIITRKFWKNELNEVIRKLGRGDQVWDNNLVETIEESKQ